MLIFRPVKFVTNVNFLVFKRRLSHKRIFDDIVVCKKYRKEDEIKKGAKMMKKKLNLN
jgi:hypothetical protein